MKKGMFGISLGLLLCLTGCNLAELNSLFSSKSSTQSEESQSQPSSSKESGVLSQSSGVEGSQSSSEGKEAEEIRIWCSETEGVATSFQTIAENWAKDNDLNYKFTVTGFTEADQATQMLNDVNAGADIYCFPQYQFARLVQGGALSKLGSSASSWVKENNDEGSVCAVTYGDSIYGYPLTSDNGYFMYYDKSVIDESHIGSLEDIIADCEAAEMNFSFNLAGSGWYTASFFMSYDEDGNQLCHSNWTTDSEGNFIGVDDNWYSDNGVIAAKGMQKLLKSDCWEDYSSASSFEAASPSAVVVSGTWDYQYAKRILGNNLGVAELPSFTVDGKSYHLGSFAGYKLLGVKPQTDVTKAANLHQLAQVLTGYDAQMPRLEQFEWGPSNKKAQESNEFKSNQALVALAKQSVYATLQDEIHGTWWDVSKTVGFNLQYADETDEAIRGVLKTYKDALDAIFLPIDRRSFTVIGSFAVPPEVGWKSWASDLEMSEGPANVWDSPVIVLTEGDEFKVRQGKCWNVSFGRDDSGTNVVVTAAEAGKKIVELVTTTDSKGSVTSGIISIIDA